MFFIGGGGFGKSYVIKLIYYIVVKVFKYVIINFELLIVLLMVLTGVFVINIEGIIMNIALVIFKDVGENFFIMFD